MEMTHVSAATYYSLNDGLNSILMVSNQDPKPLQISVTLFSLSGARFDVPPIMLDGDAVREFDMNRWVDTAGQGFREGSLEVLYAGRSMVLGGVLRMVDAQRSLIFDEELSDPNMDFKSSRLEGVWWLPSLKADVLVALSNTTNTALATTIKLDNTGLNSVQPLTLAPRETRLINLRQIATSGNGSVKSVKALARVGGISVEHSGGSGALLARGMIEDASKGYSAVIEFSDPLRAKKSRLDGTGLRLGKAGGKKLTPVLVARNVGDTPTVLTGRIPYVDRNGGRQVLALPDTELAAGQTKEISLLPQMNEIDVDRNSTVGMEFEYSTKPGTVVISAMSVSRDWNQVFRVPLVDADTQMSSNGKYPWNIQGSNSSFVYVKNVTDHFQEYTIYVSFKDGFYTLGLKRLEAGQMVMFDLRALRDSRVADVTGKPMPLDATDGHVVWSIRGPEHRALIGRAEQVDIEGGMSMTSSCPACNCPDSFVGSFITPGAAEDDAGGSSDFDAWEQDQTCSGNYPPPYPVSAWWDTSDSGTATISQSGNATAVGAGTTAISADWFALGWTPLYEDCYQYQGYPLTFAGYAVRPVVTGISPSRGAAGATTSVTISGRGFRSGASVNAGSGITVSVTAISSTSITANFAVAGNATGGNHAVSVTCNGKTSNNNYNFFVQIPSKFLPYNEPNLAPNGIGPLRTPNNEDVVLLSGFVKFHNFCGVYRSYLFFLADQEGQQIHVEFKIDEIFTNVVSAPGLAAVTYDQSTIPANALAVEDLQSVGFISSGCLLNDQYQTFTQQFKITIGTTEFLLSTTINIRRGNEAGVLKVDRTITTQ